MSSKAPNNRPVKYKLAPSKRSAAIIRGVNKLKTYKTEKSTTNKRSQDLLDLVISQYESRDILNIQTAGSMAHSLMNNTLQNSGKICIGNCRDRQANGNTSSKERSNHGGSKTNRRRFSEISR